MLVSEHNLEEAIRTFYHEAKIPIPAFWDGNKDARLLKRSVLAFLKALEKIEQIDFSYGFDRSKVFEEFNKYSPKYLFQQKEG